MSIGTSYALLSYRVSVDAEAPGKEGCLLGLADSVMWHCYVLFNIAEEYRSLQHVGFLLCQYIGAELHAACTLLECMMMFSMDASS